MSLESLEGRRLKIQKRLDSERSADERNVEGQHATPLPLAEQIVALALECLGDAPVRFLDPGVGSGAFFSALLRQRRSAIQSAIGIERDPRYVRAARQLWGDHGLRVIEADFTSAAPSESELANLLVANPPYVRHHHLDGEAKERLKRSVRQQLGIQISGLAGLYAYFLLLSHRWLLEHAIAAWLIPSEWLSVNYGSALRRYLAEKVTLLRVHVFDAADVQFGEALVSSSVVLFRREPPPAEHQASFTAGALASPSSAEFVPVQKLSWREKWSRLLHGEVRRRTRPAPVVGDSFKIRRGIATGRNSFFIRPRSEFLRLGIPGQFLRPILPPSRSLPDRLISAQPDGYPDLQEPLALLYCDLAPAVVEQDYPSLFAYLSSGEGRKARASYLARHRNPWYSQEARETAPIMVTYMGRGTKGGSPFKVFANLSMAIAANSFHLLYPKGALAEHLRANPDDLAGVAQTLEQIASVWYRQHGREYGGGLHKLEPKELASLPVDQLLKEFGLRPAASQLQLI